MSATASGVSQSHISTNHSSHPLRPLSTLDSGMYTSSDDESDHEDSISQNPSETHPQSPSQRMKFTSFGKNHQITQAFPRKRVGKNAKTRQLAQQNRKQAGKFWVFVLRKLDVGHRRVFVQPADQKNRQKGETPLSSYRFPGSKWARTQRPLP